MSRIVIQRNIAFDDIKNRYYVTLNYGTDRNGRRCKQSKSFRTKKEAQKCLAVFEGEKAKDNILFPHSETLGEYATYWLETIKAIRCEETTLYSYRKMIENHIQPTIGQIELQKLNTQDLNKHFTQLVKETKLSKNTVRKNQDLLKSILKSAVKEGKILKNPMDNVDQLRYEQADVDSYNRYELELLFEKIEGHPLEIPVKIAGYLGLRRGEINGLKWQDVDFDNKQLYIKDTRTKAGKEEILKGTKTKNSRRMLPIPMELLEVLKKEKENQERQKKEYENYVDNDYVFCKKDGTLYEVNYCSNQFKKFLVANRLRPIKFHALRHSFASIGVAAGTSLIVLSKLLGHYSPTITDKFYLKVDIETKRSSVDLIAQAINQNQAS